MSGRPAAGGGRVIEVAPERVPGWVTRFAAAHDGLAEIGCDTVGVTVVAGDGARVELAAPFPPMDPAAGEPVEALLGHIDGLGTAGIVLLRRGAHSVGLAVDGKVTVSSTDRTYVQGRTAAGGWSQQRYARRRGNQTDAAVDKAAETATRVLLGGRVPDVLVLGGDRALCDTMLADPRLRPLHSLRRRVFADVAEPRRAVLDDVARRLRSVRTTIRDPE